MLPGLVLRARASLCDCVGTYRSCVPGVGGRGVDWWAGAASVGAVAAESIFINTRPKGFFLKPYCSPGAPVGVALAADGRARGIRSRDGGDATCEVP